MDGRGVEVCFKRINPLPRSQHAPGDAQTDIDYLGEGGKWRHDVKANLGPKEGGCFALGKRAKWGPLK